MLGHLHKHQQCIRYRLIDGKEGLINKKWDVSNADTGGYITL